MCLSNNGWVVHPTWPVPHCVSPPGLPCGPVGWALGVVLGVVPGLVWCIPHAWCLPSWSPLGSHQVDTGCGTWVGLVHLTCPGRLPFWSPRKAKGVIVVMGVVLSEDNLPPFYLSCKRLSLQVNTLRRCVEQVLSQFVYHKNSSTVSLFPLSTKQQRHLPTKNIAPPAWESLVFRAGCRLFSFLPR